MQTLQQCKTDLSIIIPVYNLERFLQPMLDSMKEQQLDDYTIEILFVLNNCTDRSEEVIRSSGIDCTILTCTTQGCGPARNTALDVAMGEYIWMMDGDDWLLSDTAVLNVLEKAKCNGFNLLRIPFISDRFGGIYYSMVWQYLFRREFIDDLRFPDFQPGEDGAFMDMVFERFGCNRKNYLRKVPRMDAPQYCYNYLREGSNMFRFYRGENI